MSHYVSKFLVLCLSSVLLATQMGNGCLSDGNGDYDDDYYDRRPPHGGGYGRPGYPDHGYSGLDIPRRARVVEENRGDIMRFRPGETGRIWLVDADRRMVIDSRTVQRGEEYVISTKDGKVWIDKERVLDHNFDRDNVHRIYFLGREDQEYRRDQWDNDRRRGSGRPDDAYPRDDRFGSAGGSAVPKTASIVREGRGKDLSFVADRAGTVFLYDVESRDTLATYRLKRGERFTVSPKNGQASVDGRVAFSRSMSNKKVYRIYFDESV